MNPLKLRQLRAVLIKLSRRIKDVPKTTVYHVTPTKDVSSILATGLKRRSGGPGIYIEKKAQHVLGTAERRAEGLASGFPASNWKDYSLLKLRVPKRSVGKQKAYWSKDGQITDITYDPVLKRTVKPKNIKIVKRIKSE